MPETAVDVLSFTASNEADPEIKAAMSLIETMPDAAMGYNNLAIVYLKKARQTGDAAFNSQAQSAVDKARGLEPDNAISRRLNLSLLSSFHRFDEAVEAGNSLSRDYPNDSFAYGVLTDAHLELGNYSQAIESAQKMVDLKPGSLAYARVAQVRSIHGDHKGALEMFELAAKTADPMDKEAQSWCLVNLGKEYLKKGNLDKALSVIDESLGISPGYHLAIVEKARLLAIRGDYAAAATFFDNAPVLTSAALILRGNIATQQGKTAEAEVFYARAEVTAREQEGDIHPLALLWADRGVRLDEALDIAQRDFETNTDIYAADTLAWCLYKKGRLFEAKTAITAAMRPDADQALILYHAGMIEKGLGNRKEAIKLLTAALKQNPTFGILEGQDIKIPLKEMQKAG